MKNIFYILLGLISSAELCLGQTSRFEVGDTVYVLALKGMNLRSNATLGAPVKIKIPYGEKLIITGIPQNQDSVEVKEFEGFNVKGHFVEVEYKGHPGYIFDGYLSKLIPPVTGSGTGSGIDLYIGQYGAVGELQILEKGGENCDPEAPDCFCRSSQEYGKGIKITTDHCGNGGGTNYYYFPAATVAEAFILCRIFFITDFEIYKYDSETKQLFIEPKDGGPGCYYTIREKDDGVEIDNYCGC